MAEVIINVEPNVSNDLKKDERILFGGCCGKSCWSRFLLTFFLLAALSGVALLTAYLLIYPKPETPTSPATIAPTTTMAPSTSSTTTTPLPPTTATGKPPSTPCIPIKWLKDVSIPPTIDEDPWRVSLFSGQVTQKTMRLICYQINRFIIPYSDEYSGSVCFNSTEREERFDKIIRDHMSSVFGNPSTDSTRLLWTGCSYEYHLKKNIWEVKCRYDPMKEYNNFCDQLGWVDELEKLKAVAVNNPKLVRTIQIVKDYKEDNACWKLYLENRPIGPAISVNYQDRRQLPFTCITEENTSSSGQDAIKKSNLVLCKNK